MKQRKSFVTLVVFVVFLVFLWILAGWNTDNYDYNNYIVRYNHIQNYGFESFKLDFGYDFLEYVFSVFGASFQEFRIWIYGIGLSVLGILIWKWSYYPIYALLFYICSHFLRDTVEVRNYLASLFVLITIWFYGRKGRRKYLIITVLLFIGLTFHVAFLLYIPFVLIDYRKWNYWWLLILSLIMTLFARHMLSESVSLVEFEGMDDKVSRFLSVSPTFALIVAVIKATFNGLCVSIFHREYNGNLKYSNIKHIHVKDYSQIMYNMNALSCFMIIFTPISGSFYTRLFGNILILNVIYFLNTIYFVKKGKIALSLLLVFYMLFFIVTAQIVPFTEHLNYLLNYNSILFK